MPLRSRPAGPLASDWGLAAPPATPTRPALGLAVLAALSLLHCEALGVYRVGLCWLAFWVFQQMFQLDALTRGSGYVALAYALLLICVCFFHSAGTLSFYILFELSLLPTLFIVLLFGYQPEKLRAAQYLLLYTVLASLPLLLSLLALTPYLGWLALPRVGYLGLTLTLGFMVKSPLYLVHIWLPKAHVEAPVAASMALAGILLKLGSYGLLLFCPLLLHPLLTLYLAVSLLGGVACARVCARQWDAKRLIAFSSVVHMGVVTVGVVVGTELGYLCAYLIVVAHGICSPLLFGAVYRFYQRRHRRLLTSNRGRLGSPIAALTLFLLLAVNMGVPPFLNLWSEVLIYCCLLPYAYHSLWILLPAAFLGALYNLHLYVRLTHGKEAPAATPCDDFWAGVHSVALSFVLAGGLGFFNGP